MTDHAKAAARLLSLAGDESDDRHASRQIEAANGYAMLAIADAIRGLTPNAVQDASGDDLRASQAEPGQVDGGEATEATDQDRWDRNYFAYLAHDGKPARTWSLTDLRQFIPISDPETPYSIPQQFVLGVDATTAQHDAEQRAVKAEAERDAILAELEALVDEADDAGGNIAPDMLTALIVRNTPKEG